MRRQTIIVDGLLAYRMQRALAAKSNAVGREIATWPQVACRLAGGFVELAGPAVIFPLVRTALAEGGFSKLTAVADLPGTPRAVVASLRKIWAADLDLVSLSGRAESLADLETIERRLRAALPASCLLPPDLRN